MAMRTNYSFLLSLFGPLVSFCCNISIGISVDLLDTGLTKKVIPCLGHLFSYHPPFAFEPSLWS
eukprot:m.196247 g.196247  ORF g.196247 m.196247 type:complete len:64 (-) comp10628_c0_seq10:78-269(-)